MANAKMLKFKKKVKFIWDHIWELIKTAIPAAIMYMCAGAITLWLGMNIDSEKMTFTWKSAALVWMIICIVVAAAYNGIMAWAQGGSHYEMLASGNVKRATADIYGEGYKISAHREAKEYRVWKGFVAGSIVAAIGIAFAIAFGVNQAAIAERLAEKSMGLLEMLGIMLSGWNLLPFYYANSFGNNISYFVGIAMALLPVAITGAFYIIGAYARRNKAIRQQELADKQAQMEANKPKKINYGGLPGTKPKKRK